MPELTPVAYDEARASHASCPDLRSEGARLCIVTQYFPPEMGAAQNRLGEMSAHLAALGWQVEVLTALPNYPTGKIFDGYDPSQTIVEQIGEVRVARVPLYTSSGGFTRRLRSYFSFIKSAIRFGPSLCGTPDLLFVESPPLFIGYAAWYLAWRWKCPYVLSVSDLWPESAIRMGVVKPGIATRLATRLERRMYQSSAGVVGTSDGILRGVTELSPETPTALATNGVELAKFGKSKRDAAAEELIGPGDGPVFIFAGLLGLAQGLDQVLDLAKSLPPEVPGRFVLVGDGPVRSHLEQRICEEKIERAKLVPSQPRHRIPAILASADAAIVTMGMEIPGMIPNKLFEAMASELPVLLVSTGEPVERLRQADAGIAVPPAHPHELRQAFIQLATDPSLRERLGSNGRRAVEANYDRAKIAERLHGFLKAALRT